MATIRRRIVACLLAALISTMCVPTAFADEPGAASGAQASGLAAPVPDADGQAAEEALAAQADSAAEADAQSAAQEGLDAQGTVENAPQAVGEAGQGVERSVIGGAHIYQVDYRLERGSTVVEVTLPNLAGLLASGKADRVVVEASMSYGGAITRSVSAERDLAQLQAAGGAFRLDFGDYGRFSAIATFYKGSTPVETGDAQTVGVVADEYNIAPVSATLPVTFFSLSLWGENDIRHNERGGIVPTIVLLERPSAYNWDSLPEGVYGLPYLSKGAIAYQPPDFKAASDLFQQRSQSMADYVADLYELNPSATFNLYCVDYYLGLVQSVLYANGIPQDRYSITVLSDGAWSYGKFASVYDGADPAAVHESLKAQWTRAKDEAYRTGKASSGFALAYPNRMLYAAVDSEPNARWWLARPALLETKGDGNAFGKSVQADTDQVVRVYIDRKLAALKAQGDEAIAEFKALYNFSDSYFAAAEASGKDVMLFLGTTVNGEAGTFSDYARFAMQLYGDRYAYYYKGHPSSPTDFHPAKQQELADLGIVDVDSSVAAELILFFYPDVFLSGYSSSTYASVSNPDRAKGLFGLTKKAALADASADYSIMEWFMSPVGDATDAKIRALCKGGTNYLVEFSDAYREGVDYDIAIWNATSRTATYYRAEGGSYVFVSSNKPQAVEGTWVQSGGRWWYEYEDGTYPRDEIVTIGDKAYAFDADGWMVSGWARVADGQWRFFEDSGAMRTGWLAYGGSWYYLDPSSGAMAVDWFKVDGATWYYADDSGAMQTGWLHTGGAWYYLEPSGAMATGWKMVGGAWYYLDGSGAMRTGWAEVGGNWYRLEDSGAMATGWKSVGGTWYYLADGGAMATGWRYVGGDWYRFAESGAMQTGWVELGGTWYCLGESGAMEHDRWIGDYYVLATGAMAVDAWIGPYYVGSDGAWVPGASR